jgi:two-component system, OmpR family, sensor kinase
MWAIASILRRRWIEIGLALFIAANLAAMFRVAGFVTIPFHFVWVSLTLVYGFRRWSLNATLASCAAVCALTFTLLTARVMAGYLPVDETYEVPLMATMFLAMVWHARRRQSAMEEVRRLAESERRLREREREFVRDASHELRTPITVARGYAELIRDEHATSQTGEDAETVLSELHKLARISERLLLLYRADRADFLQTAPFDLEELLARIARRWRVVADRHWEVDADVPHKVLGDAERLETAIDALLENAVNATADGGSIALRARLEGDGVVIAVADDGVGIAQDDLARVFDRFWRVSRDRARETGGSGLGLAIVKAVVEAHGGTVGAASQPGHGTTITISLPGSAVRRDRVSDESHVTLA